MSSDSQFPFQLQILTILGPRSSHPSSNISAAIFWRRIGFLISIAIPTTIFGLYAILNLNGDWQSWPKQILNLLTNIKDYIWIWVAVFGFFLIAGTSFSLTTLICIRASNYPWRRGSGTLYNSVGSGPVLRIMGWVALVAIPLWIFMFVGKPPVDAFDRLFMGAIGLLTPWILIDQLMPIPPSPWKWARHFRRILFCSLTFISAIWFLVQWKSDRMAFLGSDFTAIAAFLLNTLLIYKFCGMATWIASKLFTPRQVQISDSEVAFALAPDLCSALPPVRLIPVTAAHSPMFARLQSVTNRRVAVDNDIQSSSAQELPIVEQMRNALSSSHNSGDVLEMEDVNTDVLGAKLSRPTESILRTLFDGPTTSDQAAAVLQIAELAGLSEHDGACRDLMIEGPIGSGRTTTLIAAALDAVIGRGIDVLIIVSNDTRSDAIRNECKDRIQAIGMSGFISADQLNNATITQYADTTTQQGGENATDKKPSPANLLHPLPHILVATLNTLELYMIAKASSMAPAQVRAIISARQLLLVDDLTEFSDCQRMQLPIVLDKFRLLIRLDGAAPQVVVVVPPIPQESRTTFGQRMLDCDGDPPVAVLRSAPEHFACITVNAPSNVNSKADLRNWSTGVIQIFAESVLKDNFEIAILLPGRSSSECKELKQTLEINGRTVHVGSSSDSLRIHRNVMPAWKEFRRRTAGAIAVLVASPVDTKKLPIVIVMEQLGIILPPTDARVLPLLASTRSWTFLVRHLGSILRMIPPSMPLDRKAWTRLGLRSVGGLNDLMVLASEGSINARIELELDPCEHNMNAIRQLNTEFWPWVVAKQPQGITSKNGPVNFEVPPSFMEAADLLDDGIRFQIGDIETKPKLLGNRNSEITKDDPQAPLDKNFQIDSFSHCLRWTNEQGSFIGTSDLAYCETLHLMTAQGTFWPVRISNSESKGEPINVTGRPVRGEIGEATNPIWRAEIVIPKDTETTRYLHQRVGGALGMMGLRFDLEALAVASTFQERAPYITERFKRRKRLGFLPDTAPTENLKVSLELLSALDTSGRSTRLPGNIKFSHKVRGVTWVLLERGLDDEKIQRIEKKACKGLEGSWSSQEKREERDAIWCQQVWPELAACLQIALRKILPGWQNYGRVIAFEPSETAADLGVRAVIHFLEPTPTQDTISLPIESIACDKSLLEALIERALESLEAIDDPMRLSIESGTNWERPCNSQGISRASQMLADLLLNLSGKKSRSSSITTQCIDQKTDLNEPQLNPFQEQPWPTSEIKNQISQAANDPALKSIINWLVGNHAIATPAAVHTLIPFNTWTDHSNCIEKRLGSTVFYKEGEKPKQFTISAQLNVSAAKSIELHFGIPQDLFTAPILSSDKFLDFERLRKQSAIMHGIYLGDSHYSIYCLWHLLACVKDLKPISESIVSAYTGKPHKNANEREVINALTSYVQNAIPYRRIGDLSDGKERWGYRTPLMTILKGGDCDSKSMLLICMVRSLLPKIKIAFIYIDMDGPHAMLGVMIDKLGEEKTTVINGETYVLIESTAPDGDIGNISDKCDRSSIQALPIASLET